jgi:hypothetical protein
MYGGPVMSYYEFFAPYGARFTDQNWSNSLQQTGPPPRPPWTKSFVGPRP